MGKYRQFWQIYNCTALERWSTERNLGVYPSEESILMKESGILLSEVNHLKKSDFQEIIIYRC